MSSTNGATGLQHVNQEEVGAIALGALERVLERRLGAAGEVRRMDDALG